MVKLLRVNAANPLSDKVFNDSVLIDDERIIIRGNNSETRYAWDLLTDVDDLEHTVLIYGPLHSVCIKANAFDGFLAKDAFVRACRHRMGSAGSVGLEAFD